MAKEETLEFEGAVTDVLPDGRFRVQLDNGHAIIAYTAGRMKRNRIKTIAGDRVTVEIDSLRSREGPGGIPPQDRERTAPWRRWTSRAWTWRGRWAKAALTGRSVC